MTCAFILIAAGYQVPRLAGPAVHGSREDFGTLLDKPAVAHGSPVLSGINWH
jgi:hypothetical protein